MTEVFAKCIVTAGVQKKVSAAEVFTKFVGNGRCFCEM
jgi:hypothetical protein